MVDIACENIDLVMSVEMRRKGLPRGKKWPMYQMAREAAGGSLTLLAARMLDRAPCRVLILTGAAVPDHMPAGENDGPIGTVVAARALAMLGHEIEILTDPPCAPPIEGLARYLGVPLKVTTIGLDDKPLQDRMVESHDLFVSIERLGGNVNGFLHGVNGIRRDWHRANLDHVFNRARKEGKPTLAIGDGGNEIGFGNLHPKLEQALPEHTFKDVTPCGGGVFSVVKADMLLVANSSNIGAYAAAAGLALLKGQLDLAHTAARDRELHLVGAGLGLVDGGSGLLRPWCDGIPPEANAAVAEIMHNIVERALEPPHLRKF